MQTHEAANLRRTYAATGHIESADITAALAELERLLAERAKVRWLVDRATQDGHLQELIDLVGEPEALPPVFVRRGDRVMFDGQEYEIAVRYASGSGGDDRVDVRIALWRVR